MAAIRPSSDLRNKYAEYERLCGKAELHRLLDEGLADVRSKKGRPAKEVFADIERKFGFDEV